jgi:uncharacterized protein involved in exopolysaccharide biosynthesis
MTDTDHAANAAPRNPTDADLVTVVGLVNAVLRQRRAVVLTGLTVAVLAVVWSFLRSAYSASASFTPTVQASPDQSVAGVAQALGINLGSISGSASLNFYDALLQSRELLAAAVRTPFHFARVRGGAPDATETLEEVYGFGNDTSSTAVLKACRKLERHLAISLDAASNVVTIRFRSPWPGLSEAVAVRLLALVNQFNVEQLQSQASAERRFVEQRRDSAWVALSSAEGAMEDFLKANRSYEGSPTLVFHQQRLQRAIDRAQTLFTALDRSYEQARLAEVRNTPVITVIDAPKGSAIRERHAVRNGLVGLLLGIVLGAMLGLGREHLLREQNAYPAEFAELHRLRAQFLPRLGRGRP